VFAGGTKERPVQDLHHRNYSSCPAEPGPRDDAKRGIELAIKEINKAAASYGPTVVAKTTTHRQAEEASRSCRRCSASDIVDADNRLVNSNDVSAASPTSTTQRSQLRPRHLRN
jgi:hypothetical protein